MTCPSDKVAATFERDEFFWIEMTVLVGKFPGGMEPMATNKTPQIKILTSTLVIHRKLDIREFYMLVTILANSMGPRPSSKALSLDLE